MYTFVFKKLLKLMQNLQNNFWANYQKSVVYPISVNFLVLIHFGFFLRKMLSYRKKWWKYFLINKHTLIIFNFVVKNL